MASLQAKRLHQRAVLFEDERLDEATLLPFFERSGIVRSILIVDLKGGEARVLPYKNPRHGRLVQVPFFKRHVVIRARYEDLRPLNFDEASELAEHWHFDPWWLLRESPFDVQPTTPMLKATNCAHLLGPVNPQLTFRRDLSRVTALFNAKDPSDNGKPWNAALLPEHQPEYAVPPARRSRWVLDPIWAASLR